MDNESLISEFAWTESDFSRVQGLIYQRAGISLHSGKHAMVYSRLSRRLRETGHQCFKDYLDFLELGENSESQEFPGPGGQRVSGPERGGEHHGRA